MPLPKIRFPLIRNVSPRAKRLGAATAALLAAGSLYLATHRGPVRVGLNPVMPETVQENSRVGRTARQEIERLRRTGVLKPSEDVSLSVYGLQSHTRFVKINPRAQRMAASLIKPFVMLAAYHKLSEGAAASPSLERDIRLMIAKSDNPATNRVLDFVGGPEEANRIVRGYGFGSTSIVENIPANERTYRNSTSAEDLNYFLWRIHEGNLINARYSLLMLSHLDRYATSRLRFLHSKYDMDLAGKTGFVSGLNGEATRVTYTGRDGKPRHYSFVIMIEDPRMRNTPGRQWGHRTSNAIRAIFRKVHEGMLAPN